MRLSDEVRAYWEGTPCGTASEIVGELQPRSREWFERVEEYRYAVEPFIHSVAQFTRHRGKRLLEVASGQAPITCNGRVRAPNVMASTSPMRPSRPRALGLASTASPRSCSA